MSDEESLLELIEIFMELNEKQDEIIRIQAGVIDELFSLLMQHISADEVAKLTCVERIEEAVRLRQEIE